MTALRRFLSIFQNSPVYARDKANLISSFNIGFCALALNSAVLMVMVVLLFDPQEFSGLAQHVEFGQLLGVILLTGASAFATALIPLRLSGVFMGPRIGRYFDQVVLTGISPIRFLMGKVTSQNLFLGLILFLLLPWLVLVLVVGGLQWHVFLGNLFLLWLYSMMLALLMLWLSLYFNEVLALGIMLLLGAVFGGLGVAAIPYQPFVLTPFPALMQEAWSATGEISPEYVRSYGSVFLSSAIAMSFVCGASFIGLCMGPLYGIIRDNSTFGEVVHAGDTKRKRRFRFRMHIQRPSEVAFFYQNRGDIFRNWEGAIRWGMSLGTLLLVMALAWSLYSYAIRETYLQMQKQQSWISFIYLETNAVAEGIHGFSLFFAAVFFSRARNTMYWKIPFMAGRKVIAATLDWCSFLFVVVLSSGLCYGIPKVFHHWYRNPSETPGMPGPILRSENSDWISQRYAGFDVWATHLECTIVLSVCAVSLFLIIRSLCLLTWVRTVAIFTGSALFGFFCLPGPFLLAGLIEFASTSRFDLSRDFSKQVAMMSPIAVFGVMYREIGESFGFGHSSFPFYLLHGVIIIGCLVFICIVGSSLRRRSLNWQDREQLQESRWNSKAFTAVICLLLFHSSSGFGQANTAATPDFPGLDIQAEIGWDGFVDHESPTPISFLITNQSEKILEGELRLEDPISRQSYSFGIVAIGPASTKRMSTIQSLSNWESCVAVYTNGSQVFWTRSLSLANERATTTETAFMLVVDESRRKVVFPTTAATQSNLQPDTTVLDTKIGQGFRVQALSIGSWQIPTHPGPLTAIQSLVFTEMAKAELLNDGQWDAIGRWICLGGTLFVHESSLEGLQQIQKACPLAVLPACQVDGFTEHRAGSGRIRVYSGKLFSGEDTATSKALGTATSLLPRLMLFSLANQFPLNMDDSATSNRTRNWVMMVFGCYTAIAGGVTFLLFRLSRRRLFVYTISIVSAACVAAAGLGIMLRNSLGDAVWSSVTQISETGAVQLANIAVRSSGGRNFHLEVTGPDVDLQLSEADRLSTGYGSYMYQYGNYYPSTSRTGASSFSLSTNLSKDADAFRIKVPITPWGQRQLMATSFLKSLSGISVKLRYEPPFAVGQAADDLTSVEQVEVSWAKFGMQDVAVLNGQWKMEIRNETPYELNNLGITVTKSSVRGYDGTERPYRYNVDPTAQNVSVLSSSDLTHQTGRIELGMIPSSKTTLQVESSTIQWHTHFGDYFGNYNRQQSSSTRPGGTGAWLTATISESPGIKINESNSDFHADKARTHVIIFRIDDSEIPLSWKVCHDWLIQRQIKMEEASLNARTNSENR